MSDSAGSSRGKSGSSADIQSIARPVSAATHESEWPGVGERRSRPRTNNDIDWERKVLERVQSRLQQIPAGPAPSSSPINWEASVLDSLRARIERMPD